jgi:hypothetical protein
MKGVLQNKFVKEIVLPLPIIGDDTQHVISNMLDYEEVFGESTVTNMKVVPMMEYDR